MERTNVASRGAACSIAIPQKRFDTRPAAHTLPSSSPWQDEGCAHCFPLFLCAVRGPNHRYTSWLEGWGFWVSHSGRDLMLVEPYIRGLSSSEDTKIPAVNRPTRKEHFCRCGRIERSGTIFCVILLYVAQLTRTCAGFGPWQSPKVFEAVALADYAAGTNVSQSFLPQIIHDIAVGPGLDW
jgi:hypothetical protein